jgi:mannose-6-phosphate isomerase-like protein (cupin superfamily)
MEGLVMKKSACCSLGLLASVLMLAGVFASPAMAQGKPSQKVLVDNDKVKVVESTYTPGDESNKKFKKRGFRVVRALTSGTLRRTYPDGKTEMVVIKAGEVRTFEDGNQFSAKNVGTSDLVFYAVVPKTPKN